MECYTDKVNDTHNYLLTVSDPDIVNLHSSSFTFLESIEEMYNSSPSATTNGTER